MLVTITLIELKNPFKFFALSYNALQIMKQLKTAKNTGYKSTGLWTTHYTMTSWDNAADMHAFARSGAHLEAMKKSADLAKELRTLTYEASAMPDWKEAKSKIMQEGKVLRF
jgi:hypothetical protein